MTTNEIYYHRICLKNFNNHYRDNLLREEKLKSLENNLNEEFSKAFAFNKIISHINEQNNLDSNKFEVTVLEAMYKDLLEFIFFFFKGIFFSRKINVPWHGKGI